MALSGHFSSYPVEYLGLYCTWSAEQSVSGNYTDITVNVYLKYHALYVGERKDAKVSINGSGVTYTVNAINESSRSAHSKLIKTYTKRVYHDSNGVKTGVPLSASWRFDGTYSGTSIGTIVASTSVNLDTIDRQAPSVKQQISNITANGFKISASADVTIDRWRYSLDGGSNYTTFGSAGTSASVTLNNLSANTTYTVVVEARKKQNQRIGKATKTATTLGASVITQAPDFAADATTVIIPLVIRIYESSYSNKLDLYDGDNLLMHLSEEFIGTAGDHSMNFELSSAQRTSLLTLMSNVKSKSLTLVIGTYNGNTLIAESSKSIKAVTSAARSAPTAGTISCYDINQNVGLYSFADGNKFIRIVSKPVFSFQNFAVRNCAAFDHVTIQIGDMPELSVNDYNVVPLPQLTTKAGNHTPKFVFYDSRGYSVTVSAFTFLRSGTTVGSYTQFNVLNYEPPQFTSIRLTRQNMVGEQIDVEVSCRYSQITENNVGLNDIYSFKCRYRKTSGGSYSNWLELSSRTGSISYASSSVSFEQSNFVTLPAEYSYDFEFSITDTLSRMIIDDDPDAYAVTAHAIALKGNPAIAIRNDPNGSGKAFIGVNNNDPTAPVDVTGNILMNGLNVLGFVRRLGAVEDLNDSEFRDSGIWTQNSNKLTYGDGAEFDNYPCERAGFLEVICNNNASHFVLQRYTAYDLSGMYIRTYYPKKVNGVEVGEWYGWREVWSGYDQSVFVPVNGVSIIRHYLTKTANLCTLYVVGTVDSAVAKGTDKQVGTIPEVYTPEYTHSTCGIVKDYNAAAAWVNGMKTSSGSVHENKRKVYIRPSVDMASGNAFEFTLIWNIGVEWQ